MFPARSNAYRNRTEKHLKTYRPKMYRNMQKAGSLNDHVESLSESIANWINASQPKEESLRSLTEEERQRELNTAFVIAESEALREYLPRDEKEEELIGPNGGYVDK